MAESGGLVVLVGIVTNILSVVGIVILNKYITSVDGFNFMIFLSFLHFFVTSLSMQALLWMKMFERPNISYYSASAVAIGSLMSVAFMNLNLLNNSVGFYQVTSQEP